MRLFIGIPLSREIVEGLAAISHRLRRPGDGLRWSSPESWHITLQFLGATTPAQFDCVVSHLRQLNSPPVPVQLEGGDCFDRVGVFFAGVHVTPGLLRLQQDVTALTAPCGFVAEPRPYHPHITLARGKDGGRAIRDLKKRVGVAPVFPEFVAREFLLYESHLGPDGSRYEVRARFALDGEGREQDGQAGL
jgi:2'-5' RNA ligase